MSWHERLWYVGIVLAASLTLAVGYHVGLLYALAFWAATALGLLLVRPR